MKTIKSVCASVALSVAAFAAFGQTRQINLVWSYSNTPPPDSFVLYGSTNLATPLTNWVAVAQIVCPIVATNVNTSLNYTNYTVALVTNYSLAVVPGQMFFTMTASNLWGMSPFSNVIGTPPVAGNVTGLGMR